MNKTIWMCWFQGEDHLQMPDLNRNCIKHCKDINKEWDVVVLSNENIKKYTPEFFDIVEESKYKRSYAAQSDLLRILLLSKYGGVWVDTTLWFMKPLSNFYSNIMNEVSFFSYRFMPRGSYKSPRHGLCEIVSWFLCVDKSNHYIIDTWKDAFISNFMSLKGWPYFTLHQTLTNLYDSDEKIKYIIDNMVQIDEKIPHSAISNWNSRVDSYVYKKPKGHGSPRFKG